jgi:uncharacterized BrkB/YihY/UPF0761 family membrane protein
MSMAKKKRSIRVSSHENYMTNNRLYIEQTPDGKYAVASAASSFAVPKTGLLAVLAAGNEMISFVISFCLFASIFRFLPSATIGWRDVWLGSLLTSSLFWIGRFLIGIYLGTSDFTGQYGSAGAVVAIVVWIYYSAQILFVGALFTREHASIMSSGHSTFDDPRSTAATDTSTEPTP